MQVSKVESVPQAGVVNSRADLSHWLELRDHLRDKVLLHEN